MNYYAMEDAAIKELSERFGMNESVAIDCVASRNVSDMDAILVFLRRYGHMIKIN